MKHKSTHSFKLEHEELRQEVGNDLYEIFLLPHVIDEKKLFDKQQYNSHRLIILHQCLRAIADDHINAIHPDLKECARSFIKKSSLKSQKTNVTRIDVARWTISSCLNLNPGLRSWKKSASAASMQASFYILLSEYSGSQLDDVKFTLGYAGHQTSIDIPTATLPLFINLIHSSLLSEYSGSQLVESLKEMSQTAAGWWAGPYKRFVPRKVQDITQPICDKINKDWNLEGLECFKPDKSGYRMASEFTSKQIKEKYNLFSADQHSSFLNGMRKVLKNDPFGDMTREQIIDVISKEIRVENKKMIKTLLSTVVFEKSQFSTSLKKKSLLSKTIKETNCSVEEFHAFYASTFVKKFQKAINAHHRANRNDAFGNWTRVNNDGKYQLFSSLEFKTNLDFLSFINPENYRFLLRDDNVFIDCGVNNFPLFQQRLDQWNRMNIKSTFGVK